MSQLRNNNVATSTENNRSAKAMSRHQKVSQAMPLHQGNNVRAKVSASYVATSIRDVTTSEQRTTAMS